MWGCLSVWGGLRESGSIDGGQNNPPTFGPQESKGRCEVVEGHTGAKREER